MEEKLLATKEILKKYGQEHLLENYENLSEENKNVLLNDILTIDFGEIAELYEQTKHKVEFENCKIEPIDHVEKAKLSDEELRKYSEIGIQEIKKGKLAAVTMAGGQGTRLGHNGPKGTFDLGLESHKSIFEILCDTLKLAKKQYDVVVPWYIMTSDENNDETVKFFEENNYFDYPKEAIKFFIQGKMPMVDKQGKILLNENGLIKQAGAGHGAIFEAMRKNGIIFEMQNKGIEWVFIGGVDNCLVKMVDPVLMGVAIDKGVTVACKSIVKANPHEKVGVFCKRNGKPNVIEYTEITDEMAEARDKDGELLYGESHILCNLFSVGAIERMGAEPLPYHVAYKKAKYIDKDGNLVVPDSPNAYKFEAFLFDAFGKVDDMAILRVKREEEFAPVKNSDSADVDCPRTARKLYKQFHHLD